MRRLLTVTMALGLVITAMNFTGIFAVFTDRATTGDNSAQSGSQPRVADLQIATAVGGTCDEVAWVDDLVTGVISATDLLPGSNSGQSVICLKNAGTADLDLAMSANDVVETETGCTGDEAAAGDATCGTPGIGDGELGAALIVTASRLDCVTSATEVGLSDGFDTFTGVPVAFGTLAAGDVTCVWLAVQMATPGQLGSTMDTIQQAQSDKVEWRYAFDGTPS